MFLSDGLMSRGKSLQIFWSQVDHLGNFVIRIIKIIFSLFFLFLSPLLLFPPLTSLFREKKILSGGSDTNN